MSFFSSALFGWSTSTEYTTKQFNPQPSEILSKLTPSKQVIAISETQVNRDATNSKDDSTNTDTIDGEEEFIEVNFKRLSYAEIATLKLSTLNKGNGNADGIAVINESELGTEFSDYQMADHISKQRRASTVSQKAIAQGAEVEVSAAVTPSQFEGKDTLYVGGKHTATLMNDNTIEEMVDAGLNENEELDLVSNDGFKRFIKKKSKRAKQKR